MYRKDEKYSTPKYGPKPKWEPVGFYDLPWYLGLTWIDNSDDTSDKLEWLRKSKIPHKVTAVHIEFNSKEDLTAFILMFGKYRRSNALRSINGTIIKTRTR